MMDQLKSITALGIWCKMARTEVDDETKPNLTQFNLFLDKSLTQGLGPNYESKQLLAKTFSVISLPRQVLKKLNILPALLHDIYLINSF